MVRRSIAGQTPIPAVGATDQHAQLQLFVEGPRDKVVTIIEVEHPEKALPIPDELENIPELTFLKGRDLYELLQAERRATRAACWMREYLYWILNCLNPMQPMSEG